MAKIKRSRQVRKISSRRIRYRVRNWRDYDRALVRRGEITLWFDRCLVKACKPPKSSRRGASREYSEAVIVCVLTLKVVFHLSNREVEGLVRSLLKLMRVKLPTPDHTTLSRRAGQLEVPLSPSASREPLQVLLDSSGVQIMGPSAWREWQNARWRQAQRGRQDFRKIHLALNAESGEIVAVEVTDKFEHDKEQVAPLLAQIPGEIDQVIADGNYDFHSAREAIETRGARDVIPEGFLEANKGNFKNVPVTNANRLINHGPTVLITSRLGEKLNVMTAAWQMPVSFKPMLVAIAIGHERFSHKLILESREFVVNIPHLEMIKEVLSCGTHSGRDTDKFKVCNLTPVNAQKVVAPIIKECIGNIECKLYSYHEAGDHTIFVGEVVAASVKEGIFNSYLRVELEQAKTLHHLGGKVFCHS